ncbi:MAG TPA: ABC transporter permease, partial [Anaerolineales bacterium]|nr:ABC transporter permease [Anaerolineales bacterium]
MRSYIIRRILAMIPTLFLASIVAFVIIQLPPGDFATAYVSGLAANGSIVSEEALESLRQDYGLNEPVVIQYYKWMSGILTRGDYGISFEHREPVSALIWDRIWLTMWLSLVSVLLTWIIAFPIGIYSAVRQYSIGDYVFTLIGFFGVSIPAFLVALVIMYLQFKYFGKVASGLFSDEFIAAAWSWARVKDLLAHLWLPALILGLGGTAELIRILRANLLDELRKPYVVTARAKGLPEWKVILKYPVRMALNPFVSTLGWILPGLISGSIILSQVMNLPTTGPLLLRSLQSQDMYLAGSMILVLSVATVVGTLVSDILLALLDPRI